MQYVINKLCMILCNKLYIILCNAMIVRIAYNSGAADCRLPGFLTTPQRFCFVGAKKAPTPLKTERWSQLMMQCVNLKKFHRPRHVVCLVYRRRRPTSALGRRFLLQMVCIYLMGLQTAQFAFESLRN